MSRIIYRGSIKVNLRSSSIDSNSTPSGPIGRVSALQTSRRRKERRKRRKTGFVLIFDMSRLRLSYLEDILQFIEGFLEQNVPFYILAGLQSLSTSLNFSHLGPIHTQYFYAQYCDIAIKR